MLRRLASVLARKREVQMLVVGLDNSGKSSLIFQMKPKKKKKTEAFEATPTVGFLVEKFVYHNLAITCLDMSGQSKFRTLWEAYFGDVEAILFVVDSSDRIRMCVAKNELDELLQNPRLPPVPMLFLANKMDLDDALTPEDTAKVLELHRITDRPWHVQYVTPLLLLKLTCFLGPATHSRDLASSTASIGSQPPSPRRRNLGLPKA